MQKSRAYLTDWTVINDPEDNGVDQRRIEASIIAASNSNLSMAVAALSGEPCRLAFMLEVPPELRAQIPEAGIVAPARISPPWGAKKRGGFYFRATMEYSDDLVRELMSVTRGVALTIGIEVVQAELGLDPLRQEALDFVRAATGSSAEQQSASRIASRRRRVQPGVDLPGDEESDS